MSVASATQLPPGRDETAGQIINFLRAEGAGDVAHSGGRTLLAHLVGTYEILVRWDQPPVVAHAALIHSVYGTDAFRRPLVPLMRRRELVSLAGEQAERLAYLFSVTPRDPLFAGTHAWLREPPRRPGLDDRAATEPPPSRNESDALVVLHMANLAEQAQTRDGRPGVWLAKLRELAELVAANDAVALPPFIAELASFDAADEGHVRDLYRSGLAAGDDVEIRRDRLGLAAAACAVVAEPCVWLAHLSRCREDVDGAAAWARIARRRLSELGTAWDKRLTFGEWDQLARRLESTGEADVLSPAIVDPAALFAAWCGRPGHHASRSPVPAASMTTEDSGADTRGRRRFHRYIDALTEAGAESGLSTYPDLEARPWHDGSDFPLARYLESHFREIREEVLALDGDRFHRESERIARTGDWDVVFFYERGRRNDEVCDACPVTARGIDTLPAMRTPAGLIYVSRMRPGTHIHPHRGPTNLRLRCHLGITVPDGDCALRVADHTRRWEEGRCLVFDDYLEHEAWNHTDQDRIVLIVDLWHPGLTVAEVQLLEGLHEHVHAYARRLHRYWAANATAAVGRSDH